MNDSDSSVSHVKSERGRPLSLRDPIFRREWDSVRRRLRDAEYPLDEPSQRDENREVLLHFACKRGPSLAVTEQLIRLHPSGVEEVNKHEDTVLHIACYYGAPFDVISCLLRRHPISISKRNRDGKTPLEIAQDHKWDFHMDQQGNAISLLRKKTYPECFDAEDKTGLPSKSAFKKWAHQPSPGGKDENVILVFCDISGFKAVNRHDGYEAGDDLIKRYAGDICRVCDESVRRPSGAQLGVTTEVFRMGGDEFAVVAKFTGNIMNAWNTCFGQIVSDLASLNEEKPLKYYTFLRLGCVAGRAGKESTMKLLLKEAESLQKEIGERIDPNRNGDKSLAQVYDEGISTSSDLIIYSEDHEKYGFQGSSRSIPSKSRIIGMSKSKDGRAQDQEIDAYFVFQPLPFVLGPKDVRHDTVNVHYIARIMNHIKDRLNQIVDRNQYLSILDEFMRKGREIAFSDGWDKALCDMQQYRIHMIVWCAEGVDLLEEKPIKTDCITLPQVVVVVMKYGARRVARNFSKIGVSTVIWIPLDPYDLDPLDLFNPILVSCCELMSRQSASLEESFERLRDSAKDNSGIDTSLWGFETNTQRIPPVNRTILDGQLKVHPPRWATVCRTNLVELSSSELFDGLKMQAADVPVMTQIRGEIIQRARAHDENYFLHICDGNRKLEEQLLLPSRAFAWELCKSFLYTRGFIFHSGVFYLSYTNENDISSIKDKVSRPVKRLLLWVDLVDDEDSDNLDCIFKKWLDLLTTSSFIIFTHHGSSCGRVTKLVGSGYRRCRHVSVATEDIPASGLHENIRLELSCEKKNVLDNVICNIDKVKTACQEAVLTFDANSNQSTVVAAIYSDENGDGQYNSLSLVFRIWCCNINYMTRLRDRFLICGETNKAARMLSTELCGINDTFGSINISFDRTAFANVFECSVLRLEEMTKHQFERFNECKTKILMNIETKQSGMRTSSSSVDLFKTATPRFRTGLDGFVRWVGWLVPAFGRWVGWLWFGGFGWRVDWLGLSGLGRMVGRLGFVDPKKTVHIRGPAGSGKTFLAVNLVEEFLRRNQQQKVLFVSTRASLGIHFVKWLCRRMNNEYHAEKCLERIFLFDSLGMEINGIKYDRQRGRLVRTASINLTAFGVIIVDEAQHIFNTHEDNMVKMRSKVTNLMSKCSPQPSAVLLLSDISQASTVDGSIAYPSTSSTIDLSEVVRSSKRIVAGSLLYQLGDKLHTSCNHDSLGPPIKTYIFRLDDEDKFQTYAKNILKALNHLLSPKCFPGLELHDRVAILVPNDGYRRHLLIALKHELAKDTLKTKTQNAHFVSALAASELMNFGAANHDIRENPSIVLDTVSEFSGQERLIVFGVGLDRPIDFRTDAKRVRCEIYQTISRAQMVLYLINEFVEGGWFEWIYLQEKRSGTEFSFEEFLKSINDASSKAVKMDGSSTLNINDELEGGHTPPVSLESPQNRRQPEEGERTNNKVARVVEEKDDIEQQQQYPPHHERQQQENSRVIENFDLFDTDDNEDFVVEVVNTMFLPVCLANFTLVGNLVQKAIGLLKTFIDGSETVDGTISNFVANMEKSEVLLQILRSMQGRNSEYLLLNQVLDDLKVCLEKTLEKFEKWSKQPLTQIRDRGGFADDVYIQHETFDAIMQELSQCADVKWDAQPLLQDSLGRTLEKEPQSRTHSMSDERKSEIEAEFSKLRTRHDEMVASTTPEEQLLRDSQQQELERIREELARKNEELQMWKMPLHLLIQERSWDALIKRVQGAPDSIPNDLLLSVCRYDPLFEVVEAIVQANEDILMIRNAKRDLPLHVVCWYGANISVVRQLVDLCPESLFERNSFRKLALDNAQTSKWIQATEHQTNVVKYLRLLCHKDYFDDMTGLPGRVGLDKWAPLPPPGVQKADAKVFVLNIDISGFKAVNDNTKDYKIGDDAIRQYAKSIEDICEEYVESAQKRSIHIALDVFRPGGDEFVVAGKFEKSFRAEAVWTNTIKPLVETLGDLTFDDKEKPCRYCTFLRIGCCTGNLDRVVEILKEADKLQCEIKEAIGLERGGFISLRELREKGISNFSEQYVELM